MCVESDDMEHFNIWMLEGVAYQLCREFITLSVNEKEACSSCMYRLISVWSHLVAWLPDIDVDTRVMNWAVVCDLIAFSYMRKKRERLEELVNQVELQKCRLKVSDDNGSRAVQFLHTMITLYHLDAPNVRKARYHMQKHKVLHEDELSALLKQTSHSAFPEELKIESLQAHILPYVKDIMKALGKPRFLAAITMIEKQDEHSRESRMSLDAVVAGYLSAQNENNDVHVEEMQSAVLSDRRRRLQVSCDEVSSSNDKDISVNLSDEKSVRYEKLESPENTTLELVHVDEGDSVIDVTSEKDLQAASSEDDKSVRYDKLESPKNTTLELVHVDEGDSVIDVSSEKDLQVASSEDDDWMALDVLIELCNKDLLEKVTTSEDDLSKEVLQKERVTPGNEESIQSSSEDKRSKNETSADEEYVGCTSIPKVCKDKRTLQSDVTLRNQDDKKELRISSLNRTYNLTDNSVKRSGKKKSLGGLHLFSDSDINCSQSRTDNLTDKSINWSGTKKYPGRRRILGDNTHTGNTYGITNDSRDKEAGSGKRKCHNSRNIKITHRQDDDGAGETLTWSSDDDVQTKPIKMLKIKKVERGGGRMKFSEEEEGFVVEGVERFGVGNWRRILHEYPFHDSRTNVSIKDKYRNLVKTGVIKEK